MKKEIVFIIDRSGSMNGREADVIGGYNSFLEDYKGPDCIVTTALFDNVYQMLYDGLPAKEAALQKNQYSPRGSTALYDAIGHTIEIISARHAKIPLSERPHVYMAIFTDGMENASRRYSNRQIKDLISEQQEVYGWKIFFFGGDIDTERTSQEYNLAPSCVYSVDSSCDDMYEEVMCLFKKNID